MKIKIYLQKASTRRKQAGLMDLTRHVCFRVYEGETDIYYRSSMLANADYWRDSIPGYISTVKLPEPEIRQFNKRIADISSLISAQFNHGRDVAWLRELVEDYLQPTFHEEPLKRARRSRYESMDNLYMTLDEGSFPAKMLEFIYGLPVCKGRKDSLVSTVKKLRRYEMWVRTFDGKEGFNLYPDTITTDDILDFRAYIENEYLLYKENPGFFEQFRLDSGKQPKRMSENYVMGIMKHIKGFMNYNLKNGLSTNAAHKNVHLHRDVYATPIYLTIEERDKVLNADLGKHHRLKLYRDMFMFQCFVGCRVGDLYRLTYDNIKDGWLEYYPHKGIGGENRDVPILVRVPLCAQVKALLQKYEDSTRKSLFPLQSVGFYNYGIKMLLLLCGVDRLVTVRDPETKEFIQVPLYEAATTHTGRKTFIANLYKKVQDPNLIASMTGHVIGSRAFNRYREISGDM